MVALEGQSGQFHTLRHLIKRMVKLTSPRQSVGVAWLMLASHSIEDRPILSGSFRTVFFAKRIIAWVGSTGAAL